MSLEIEQSVCLTVGLTRVREALARPAMDHLLAELRRESIVLSLFAVASKKDREGGRMPGGKGPHLLSTPGQARLH